MSANARTRYMPGFYHVSDFLHLVLTTGNVFVALYSVQCMRMAYI